jgi:hypothetical protein
MSGILFKALVAGLAIAVATTSGATHAATTEPENASAASTGNILASLSKSHPRLLASAKDFARLKERIAADPQAHQWYEKIHERGQRMLKEEPARYEIPDGLRLLATSRRVLNRVYTLAMLYRLEGDQKLADRAWRELDAAAKFPDWNPRHFLDAAEMTHAFAIGYDWLYDVWTKQQRDTLRTAIVKKGLEPALDIYRGKVRSGWWTKSSYNWNQVCNGGIGIGALAIGDEVPVLAEEILHDALQSLPLAMKQYAPDGAWPEGPGYWQCATSYNVVFLAALDSACGTDFGLSRIDGFSQAGWFPNYMTGPLGKTFNFADAKDGTIRASEMFWLARRFGQPAFAAYEMGVATPSPLDLLWFDTHLASRPASDAPLDKYFRGTEVVTFRSAWHDKNALFIGFKAGDNKVGHSHLDLGTFVLDALGQRWAVDLGSDDYNLPGYFGKQRWQYYRLRAEGHNTLVIGTGSAPDQDPKATARIVRFQSGDERSFAIADLTSAYANRARRVERGISLVNRQQVLVQDEIQTSKPEPVWWFLHTRAEIKLGDPARTATLTIGKAQLKATILSPDTAQFIVMNATPLPSSPHPPRQAQNEGVRKLAIYIPDVQDLRLTVLLTPLRDDAREPFVPKATPLKNW